MGKLWKRWRRPRKNSKKSRNDSNVFADDRRKRLDANVADGETSSLKTMGRGSKRPRNANKSDRRQRLDANAADVETSSLKTMGRGSKRLRNANKSGYSSDAEEEPVFNLGGDNTNETESRSNDDDDDNIDEDIQPNKFSGKNKEEQRKAAWVGRKSWYYDADNAYYGLQSSDEDLSIEEEAEAVRIQKEKAKFLSLEDFGLEEADESGSDSHAKEKKQKAVLDVRKSRERFSVVGFCGETTLESFEEIKIDRSSLSKEELMDEVYRSAPELVGLLSELSEAWSQLEKLEPLVCKVKERKDGAKGRMHHLEVKWLLSLTYCQAIVFFLLLKAEGHTVHDHPVLGRLVEIKALLEQMKQIEENIPSRVNKNFIQKVAKKSAHKLVNQSEIKQIRQHKAMTARRAAPYGGEPGGINPYLIRSIRLS